MRDRNVSHCTISWQDQYEKRNLLKTRLLVLQSVIKHNTNSMR